MVSNISSTKVSTLESIFSKGFTCNIVSGNTQYGISVQDSGTDSNIVQGNYVGLNAAGTAVLGNDNTGIFLGYGASNNTVGGLADGAENVVSGT